jgi:tetratricopeptide (TPR) repeat protein
MQNSLLITRIHELEKEIQTIKDVVQPRNRGMAVLENGLKFVVTYWPILSVLAAIGTIIYVQLVFHVDYFEDYRSIATTRKLSGFYSQLGDNLMYELEWEAAEQAYQRALEIDKNNSDANYGIVKSQVFQPLDGQDYYVNEIVSTKLDYLVEHFPDDYQVYYLKGLYYLDQNNLDAAEAMFNMAVLKNPQFTYGYIALGGLSQKKFNLPSAIKYYEKAVEIEPNQQMANNNVGFCYLLMLDFNQAIPHLNNAYNTSPSLLTLLNLGDAYLFSGDINNALSHEEFALRMIEKKEFENERFMEGAWLYSYMPLQPGDLVTPTNYVEIYELQQKQMLVHYNLSFGYALTGDFEGAEKEFAAANQLDPYQDYNDFFASKMGSIVNLVNMSDTSRAWFENHRAFLQIS